MDSGGGNNEGCCRDSAKKSVLYPERYEKITEGYFKNKGKDQICFTEKIYRKVLKN